MISISPSLDYLYLSIPSSIHTYLSTSPSKYQVLLITEDADRAPVTWSFYLLGKCLQHWERYTQKGTDLILLHFHA